ncbi:MULTISPECIES: magnesium transporter [Peptoniphilus]|jgi:magnesium transporter|uniref:magnesium transporter n=2 Tax=Peptoniphilaceae TaxID=1570339 RepID=UPI00028A0614|nr:MULTISPECIES: magnesium transporter [Peptoniphilus]MBS6610184.1 magnesium transporter [Peptoniphilus harei]MDU1043324.1 magnesium transporter [Peptoniphilus rhinitidis]MDU1954040.1 magnesium transporter [Peptoniphilus lacydonensis]MDU2110510.1 magnesium transporter [Peptoniphilus lacydonensis]MDU2115279.1 magnesium transporter [Peptoniphilus lacydonensis]
MELIEEMKKIISVQDKNLLNNLFEEYHPVDLGIESEDLEEDELRILVKNITHENLALLLESSEEELDAKIMSFFTNDELIEIFTHMEHSIVADLLGVLSTVRRKSILSLMKSADQNILKMILSFDEESAGGIMTTNFISLRENLTAEEAIKKIRTISPETEIIDEIFVTDNYHRLRGIVTLRDLLVSSAKTVLKDILEEVDFYVFGTDDQEVAANLFSKYELDILPVVNNNMAILGVITSEDIIAVIDQEHNEDILQMHGVNADEEYDSNWVDSFKSRIPWLIVNLLTAFLASSVVKSFESTISQVVVLSAAMPIVTGMGGNAGSQTLSIILTSLARGELSLKEDYKLVFKEIFLGLFEGAIIGILAATVFVFWHKNIYLGLILFLAMILNMIIACSMGFLIPLILDKLKVDPAIASSIFLTTFTDVFGFFIFLGLATIFLPKLI